MLLFVCVIDRVFDGGEGKKPRLTVDTSRDCQPLCEALSSNESFTSSFIGEREEGEGARGGRGRERRERERELLLLTLFFPRE